MSGDVIITGLTKEDDTSVVQGESLTPSSIRTHISWGVPATIVDNIEHYNKHIVTDLAEPGPLDVGVLLVTDTPNHPVVVHGVDDGGRVLGALGPLHCLQEEGIVVASLLGEQLVLLKTCHR